MNTEYLKEEAIMIKTTLVQIRVDEALKDEVTNIYNHYGLDLPTAIRIFMKKTVAVNGLPFDLRDESNKKNIWHYFFLRFCSFHVIISLYRIYR